MKALRNPAFTSLRQNQIRFVLFAHVLYYLAAIEYLINYGFGIFPIGAFFILLSYTVLAYAITKHELMDIRVAITRTAAYGIVAALLVGSFAWLNSFLMPTVFRILANCILGLFWAWGAHRLRAFIQTPLEEKWITGWYDSDKLLNSIAMKLVPVMERQQAFKIVADELKNTIKIKEVELLAGQESLGIDEVKRTGKRVEIPLKSSAGLEGILRLGEKISEDPYDEKDLRLFQTLRVQVLAILDRIRPYEEIKEEFEANQKKLYETEKQLERSQRLVSLGTVAAGVAHEIRNPLATIMLKTQNLPDTYELKEFKAAVTSNIERATSIIRQMLKLSKAKEKKAVEVDLNKIINETLELFTVNKIRLVKNLESMPAVRGDPEEIKQVFINLIENAVHAMKEGGELKIASYYDEGPAAACVEISDTGAGIPEEIKERIFDPFFSTRHEGVGLGLPIAYRIIREHSGNLEVKSKVGEGTTFTVRIPVTKF